ncbi:RND family transporter [Pseudomonas sp. CG7]|uniref:efflux RND transporter permease subunit n=1 Tax=Pseudomonas sp. CG7 TaxID=191007 RepID=UPI002033E4D1|nr:MMPL family transporter [Pseudomonas sp. CG7]MCM2459324.1 RND family transporter [Pseudomonas sp. CG7]
MGSNVLHQPELPVITDRKLFDAESGSWLERSVFNHRLLILVVISVISCLLAWQALKLPMNASFERMIPESHPWIQNYFENKDSLAGQGNTVKIVVENRSGTVFDSKYLEVLRKINDEIYLTPGVDRSWVRSLWMPIVRWTEVTEEGYRGGPVMPDGFDGSPEKIQILQDNVRRSGIVGSLVSNDLKSSLVQVPILETLPNTGALIDYRAFNDHLNAIISKYDSDGIGIHIVGFAKLAGDLIVGLSEVMTYFLISVVIATLFIFVYTRCWRSTLLLVSVSMLGVVWMLGLMQLLGFVLDPYSILGPFLIFAIGLSHGAQKINGIMQDVGRGTHKYVAARYTFRRLFFTGFTALIVNVAGFAVLMIIDIPVIRDLALTTSLGVAVLILTKLVLIPVLLSYTGISPQAAQRSLRDDLEEERGRGVISGIWRFFALFTTRRWAITAILVSLVIGATALVVRTDIQVGDLDAGAPELRPNSRYNQDIAFVNANFGQTSDQFTVIVKTPPGQCESFQTMTEVLRLSEVLRDVPGVLAVRSVADAVKSTSAGLYEGNPKWMSISRTPSLLVAARGQINVDQPELTNNECAITPVIAYLSDHRAQTLQRVSLVVQEFAKLHDTDERKFLLAAGTAGIEAATNIVVHESFWRMHFILYGAVSLLCFITFRSWRATVVALVPLVLTSILCEALMGGLGIGVKVATLPVIALGGGVGVDYALYLLSIQLAQQRGGKSLQEAHKISLKFTGKVVGLVGLMMAAGVFTWILSPIKFQADMGILLTFMFLWNMIGSLVLIPALSYFLLRDTFSLNGAELEQPGRLTASQANTTLVSRNAAKRSIEGSIG